MLAQGQETYKESFGFTEALFFGINFYVSCYLFEIDRPIFIIKKRKGIFCPAKIPQILRLKCSGHQERRMVKETYTRLARVLYLAPNAKKSPSPCFTAIFLNDLEPAPHATFFCVSKPMFSQRKFLFPF